MANRRFGNRPRPNRPESPYQKKVLAIDRVSRVVKGGRRFRWRAVVVLGDGQGLVGVGVSKGADNSMAINKASAVAEQQMFKAVIDETTVPHEVTAKVGGAKILIKPARPGTGLVAGSVSRVILDSAGYHDVYSKSLGNSNKVNRAYATVAALKQLVAKADWPDYYQPRKSRPPGAAKADLTPKATTETAEAKQPAKKTDEN